MANSAVTLLPRLNAAEQLRALADDIEESDLCEAVKVVSVVEWPGEIEVYAGGEIPSLAIANMLLDFGKKRIIDLEYPE